MKQNSFYNNGQQPRIFTDKSFEKNNKSWHYDCSEVSYSRSDLSIKSSKPKKPKFYTLSFTYEFKQDFDQVYFSHCFPYTYLDLVSYIRSSEKLESVKKFLKIERIGRTTIGNEIFCFIITNDIIHKFPFYINSAIKNKKMIFLTGRVHPGESNSSWIIKGMLDFLMGDHIWVDYLRNNYVFVVIPMLNPDGVR